MRSDRAGSPSLFFRTVLPGRLVMTHVSDGVDQPT